MIQIWDAQTGRFIRRMSGHTGRSKSLIRSSRHFLRGILTLGDRTVGCLAWNEHILSSGSHDRAIFHRDVRIKDHWISKISVHKQEVCGLKWSEEGQLASGGNDNKLYVFDKMNEVSSFSLFRLSKPTYIAHLDHDRVQTPLHRFTDHVAAVKAIAWNPHQHGILASGGGTADQKLRFWNTLTGNLLQEVDTGSQVSSRFLEFSPVIVYTELPRVSFAPIGLQHALLEELE